MKKLGKIAIIDYHMSNIYSINNALDKLGFKCIVSSKKKEILSSDGAVLPGVGSFPEAINHLNKLELIEPIKDFILTGKPFMGICLGLQLLFSKSEEFGFTKGLEIINGSVINFRREPQIQIVPHVGWNKIYMNNENIQNKKDPLINISSEEYFYFVHSFYVQPNNNNVSKTYTEYNGFRFCSSILKDNIFACQFHPEKSGKVGLSILNEFFSK